MRKTTIICFILAAIVCLSLPAYSQQNDTLYVFDEEKVIMGDSSATGTHSDFRLSVHGKTVAKDVAVTLEGWDVWPDFVFDEDYNLMSLKELEKHIQTKKHLPGIPSEREVEKEGVNLSDMQAKLLQKIEELTLHLIEQNKKLNAQRQEMEKLVLQNEEMKRRVKELEEAKDQKIENRR